MVETMTGVQVIVPCPSCARPMISIDNSWQCLACHPVPVNIPICKTQICKRPLTKLGEPWNCWICLKCNKHPEVVNKMVKEDEQRKRKYLDKKLTTEDVSEMIKKEMAGVKDMIREAMSEFANVPAETPDYPPPRAEITQIAESVKPNAVPVEPKPETYMQKAKRLGIPTHRPDGRGMLKKEDVLADIAAKEKAEARADAAVAKVLSNKNVPDEETIEEANTFREAAQSLPSDDDEFARGLTKEDIM